MHALHYPGVGHMPVVSSGCATLVCRCGQGSATIKACCVRNSTRTGTPVSDETLKYWQSFVGMILNVRLWVLRGCESLLGRLQRCIVVVNGTHTRTPYTNTVHTTQGYFERRMSWFPLERLQLERAFTTGQAERPDVVAESARIVFTTLEVIAPQFPSM